MQFSAEQIATILQGFVEGTPDTQVHELAKIEEASSGSLTFLSNLKYESHLYTTNASVVIINEDLVLSKPVNATLIRVKNAYLAFTELLKYYVQFQNNKSGREEFVSLDATATVGDDCYLGSFCYIGKNAKIGNNVKIYPHVYVGDDVIIGDNSTLFPGVRVYNGCIIGQSVTLHSGVIIGSDGFGFAPVADGTFEKIPQIGNVIIEDNVEIGSNTTVDRATLGSTIIGKGVKLDNLIQVAHNVEIGKNTVVAAQAGISGSTKIGEQVIIGGQVGIVGHINIAKGTQIQAQSGINKTISIENKKWAGSPSTAYTSQLRSQVIYSRLPELERRIQELEELLKNAK